MAMDGKEIYVKPKVTSELPSQSPPVVADLQLFDAITSLITKHLLFKNTPFLQKIKDSL